jgi:hypothetical protein
MIAQIAQTLPGLGIGQATLILVGVAVLALNGWNS